MVGQPWNVDAMRKVGALLRSWGWTVLEMDGWTTRGVEGYELRADWIVAHHTAAAVDIDRILRDGRSDLAGPLCNFALHANGDVVLVAAGKANHCGVASISSQDAWGIEATGPIPTGNTGRDAFPNYRAYTALVVAIRMVEGWPVSRIRAHKEIALPDGRKPDPAFEEGQPGDGYPAPYPEMDRFRAACNVTQVLRTAPQEDAMPLDADTKTYLDRQFATVVAKIQATGARLADVQQEGLDGRALILKGLEGLDPAGVSDDELRRMGAVVAEQVTGLDADAVVDALAARPLSIGPKPAA